MPNKKSNTPAVKEENLPSYAGNNQDLGDDTIGQGDIVVPRMNVCQAQSQAKDEGVPEGAIYHSVDKKDLGAEVPFHILMHWASDIWFASDFSFVGTKFTNPVTKEEELHGQEGTEEQLKNAQNYMIILTDELKRIVAGGKNPEFLIFSPKSAAVKYAREVNSAIKRDASRGVPIWAKEYTAFTEKEKFTNGSAYMVKYNMGKFASDAEAKILEACRAQAKKLMGSGKVTMKETEGDEETPF